MRFFLLLLSIPCFGADRIAQLPVAFEARQGEYFSHGNGYSLTVTQDASRLSFGGQHIGLRVIGASGTAVLEGLDPMPARANYFRGSELRESFELFSRVRRRGVYPGTDLVFRGNQDELEYDFVLAPGRNPGRIAVAFEGADRIHIDPHGDLILNAGAAEIREPKPEAYQVIAGIKRSVTVAYRLDGSNHIRFRVGHSNPKYSLVIDPQIVFDNSFGGSASSQGVGLALDAQGNIFVAGQTISADFPIQNAAQGRPGGAALLASSDGGQSWTRPTVGVNSVYLMAAAPSQPSVLYAASEGPILQSTDGGNSWTAPANKGFVAGPAAIAVDSGSPTTLYAARPSLGVFVSTDGAATWTAVTNGLVEMNSSGPGDLRNIVAHPTQPGTVFALSVSPSVVYRSADFGQTWTALDIKNVTGNGPIALLFSPADPDTMYLGQQSGPLLKSTDGGDTWTILSTGISVFYAKGLAISPANPAVLFAATSQGLQRTSDGGQTWTTVLTPGYGNVSTDPGNPNTVYELDTSGLYRSTDGGQTWTKVNVPGVSQPTGPFVSPEDSKVFVGGNSQTDAFVTKWSPDGSQILYSTYLGGSGNENTTGLAVDSAGNAYVTGYTTSQDFPLSANAIQSTLTAFQTAFVSKLSPDGSRLMYSTLLPASMATNIAVDSAGSAIVTGTTAFGIQRSLECNTDPGINFPTSGNAFVMKLAADGGSLLYSAQLNGSCWSEGQGLAVDASGNLWVSGQTTSPDLPVTQDALQTKFGGGHYDGFLGRLDASGSIAYLTYLGGLGYESMGGIAFDQAGNIYLTGTSGGLPQPAPAGAFQPEASATCDVSFGTPSYTPQGNAFVLKLDPAAHAVLALTYLGAPFCLFGGQIAVDASGSPWITGSFSPYDYGAPQTASPFQIGIGSSFISKFSPDLTQLLFSTYFDPVGGLVLDSAGMAYVSGSGPSNPVLSKQQAYVRKIDPTPPAISLDAVPPAAVSPYLAAPFIRASAAIAPGDVVRVLGKKMGPSAPTPGVINSGVLANSVAGVQVTFDGMAAPLLSVSDQEIDLVTPFELAGKTATIVQVQYNGVKSNPVQIALTPMAKEILAVLNEDYTPNSASNPAQHGSIMMLYVSGLGQTNPPSQDGHVNSAPLAGASMPIQLVWYEIDPGRGVTLMPIAFSGAAPGLAAGILQINFVAPQQSLTGVHLVIGNESLYGPPSLDIAVQ